MSDDSMNSRQLEAVHHLASPCLVLAGAGSGKTRVIVHKIARLLQSGLEPKQIAAITFTNKAAAEMRERAKALVGGRAAKSLVVSTFHSLGVRLLRADGERIGLKPNFSILDSDDVLGVLRDAGGTTDAKLARRWQWAISLWKNQGLDASAAEGAAENDDERVAARVMKRYEERLAAYQAVDFDDLIGLPLKLLQRDDETRAKWRATFEHVLVDEYQDTNSRAVRAAEDTRRRARPVHRRRRRRPEHLRLARRDDRQPEAPARGLSEAEGDRAGAELPLHRRDPRRGQRGDRRQPEDLREEAVERVRPGRSGARAGVRRRRARGRARGGAGARQTRRRRAGQVQRLRRALPRQPPGARLRAETARGADPVQGLGRSEFFRPRRDQGPVRLAAPARQQRRRPGLPARGDHAQARHRPRHAGVARRVRVEVEGEPVRSAVRAHRSAPR